MRSILVFSNSFYVSSYSCYISTSSFCCHSRIFSSTFISLKKISKMVLLWKELNMTEVSRSRIVRFFIVCYFSRMSSWRSASQNFR